MKLNSQMQGLVRKFGIDPDAPVPPHAALLDLANSGFARVGDSMVLRALLEGAQSISTSDFPDETGYESFVNHIHIEDYLPMSTPSSALANGISLANNLKALLRKSFPDRQFEIIVSYEEGHCVVRFHQQRTGQHWLQDNLDGYQQDALMVLTT